MAEGVRCGGHGGLSKEQPKIVRDIYGGTKRSRRIPQTELVLRPLERDGYGMLHDLPRPGLTLIPYNMNRFPGRDTGEYLPQSQVNTSDGAGAYQSSSSCGSSARPQPTAQAIRPSRGYMSPQAC
jgi:hypothetical protein